MDKKPTEKTSSFFEVKSSVKGVWGMYLSSLILLGISLLSSASVGITQHTFLAGLPYLGILGVVISFAMLAAASITGSIIFRGMKQVLAILTAAAVAALVLYFIFR